MANRKPTRNTNQKKHPPEIVRPKKDVEVSWLDKVTSGAAASPGTCLHSIDPFLSFTWETSDVLNASEITSGGRFLYNKALMSLIMHETGFGHWGGWQGDADAPRLITAQARRISDDRAYWYASIGAEAVADMNEDGGLLLKCNIGTLVLCALAWGESLKVTLGDQFSSSTIFLCMPRLIFPLIEEIEGEYLELLRFPFYSTLYDQLSTDGDAAVPKAAVIESLRQRNRWSASAYGTFLPNLPLEVLREVMCWLESQDVLSFGRASSWTYHVASDDNVWCWHCAREINLNVLPLLIKRGATGYKRLWIRLNNCVAFTFVRSRKNCVTNKYGQNFSHFVLDLKIGAIHDIRRSPFPNRLFAPERAKE